MKRNALPFKLAIALLTVFFISSPGYSQSDFWEQTNGSGFAGFIKALAINSNDDIFIRCWPGVCRSTDNGDNWSEINAGLPTIADVRAFAINSSGHIFAGTQGEGIFRSTNNGDNWSQIKSTNAPVFALAISGNGDIFAGTQGEGIFRSSDNGDTWDQINNGLTIISIRVNALAVNSSGHIFTGTESQGLGMSRVGGVYRSTNNGDNWDQINTGLSDDGGNGDVLAVSNNDILFAGVGSSVYRSNDNGDNWSQINTNTDVRAFAINSADDIFATTLGGTSNGVPVSGRVFRSTDTGETWNDISSGLDGESRSVWSLAINSRGILFAGVDFAVFRSLESTTAVEEISTTIPALFALEQNYPNPFNPSTTIQFAVATHTHVTVKVFDVLGREVAALVNETLAPKVYKVNFEGSDLPNGVYFYKLEAGGFSQTKKLTLLK